MGQEPVERNRFRQDADAPPCRIRPLSGIVSRHFGTDNAMNAGAYIARQMHQILSVESRHRRIRHQQIPQLRIFAQSRYRLRRIRRRHDVVAQAFERRLNKAAKIWISVTTSTERGDKFRPGRDRRRICATRP